MAGAVAGAASPGGREAAFVQSLDTRIGQILAACSRCGRCVEVCPTARPAGIDTAEPGKIVEDVLAILRREGRADSRGARWAETCTGSGRCLDACQDGVNPRFMLAMARMRLHEARTSDARRAAGQTAFQKMSESVKVLSRLQLPPDVVAGWTQPARRGAGDIVLYLGCNVLKTPHIAMLCMDVLDRLGARYRIAGGPANCCGILQFRAGDARTSGRIGRSTVAGFADSGAKRVLTWCPTCTIQLEEIVMPGGGASFGLEHVIPFIAARLDRLRPHLVHAVRRRVALHEHPGVRGVTDAVIAILRAIPGLELVDLGVPRVGYMCNSLATIPAYKRELQRAELDAAAAAGVECLVGVYHACHRELCAHEARSPFRVVNFLELVGESMGVEREDLFKQWKVMQDADRVLAEVAPHAVAAGLDLAVVRETIVANLLGEQPLPLDRSPRPTS